MVKIKFSYETEEEKEKFISDLFKHRNHRVMHISKEYLGKGKSPYKNIHIDLSNK